MEMIVRHGKDNQYGYVENFSIYAFGDTGNISMTIGVEIVDGKCQLKEPYVFRGGMFIPLSQIEEEMGIEKYIKAKKPFYCLLKGGFIVSLKIGTNFVTKEFIPDKSQYTIHVVSATKDVNEKESKLILNTVMEVPEVLDKSILKLMEDIAPFGRDREAFLRSRLK